MAHAKKAKRPKKSDEPEVKLAKAAKAVEGEEGGASKTESASAARAEVRSQVEAEAEDKAKGGDKDKSKSKTKPASKDKDKDKAKDKGVDGGEDKGHAKGKADAKGKDKPASKAETKPASKAGAKPLSRAQAKAVSKAAAKAEDKAKAAVEAVADAAQAEVLLAAAGDQELAPAQAKQLVEEVAARIIADAEATAERAQNAADLTELLRLTPGAPVDLSAIDPRSTPGVVSRAKAEAQFTALADRVGELQERLYAAAAGAGSQRRVLLVLQGMDTSGKGGTVRHVVGLLDPNGTRVKAFKAPTAEELEHDFLWRVRANLPEAGQVGIFDRSHYEDVLVAKVRKLAPPMQIGRRYGTINRFEKSLADEGCVVVKCFLHISPEQQRERLLARLDNPDKRWKFNPRDVDDRLLWPDFQEAYRVALERCGTEAAPWHVIPADRKWYRNYAVLRLLIEALEGIDPQYPPGEFDLEAQRARVLAS
jgi:PPK2 family polyphosphate:nucleotide phosphotransferase